MSGGGPDVVPAAAGGTSASPTVVASAAPVDAASPETSSTASAAASPERTLVPSDIEPTPSAPAATSGSTQAPPAAAATYKVKSGDSLSAIAAAHDTTWQVLAELNGIADPQKLRVGQVLTLP
jgi:resuscitation-promoting factor RpfA